MKYLLLIIVFIFVGCIDPFDTDARVLDLKKPIILLGSVKSTGSIILKDSTGKVLALNGGFVFSKAICESYAVGDTIIR